MRGLEIGLLEKNTRIRLQPLTEALKTAGIPVVFLPQETGAYQVEAGDTGEIAIVVPVATGITTNRSERSAQTVDIEVVIRYTLPKRYQNDATEVGVLEWCCDRTIELLLGYSPYPDEYSQRPYYLKNYELFRPEHMWVAEMRWGTEKQIRATEITTENDIVQQLELLASRDLEQGVVINQWSEA